MRFCPTKIGDVIIVGSKSHTDQRGYFMESWNKRVFVQNNIDVDFVQDNLSSSSAGTLRGLHYQLSPHAQGKLVRVTRGRVFDVAVDIRRSSATFGQWVGLELSEDNKLALYIPPGFAHGFLVLSPKAEFSYKCTDFYAPSYERGIIWNDPVININWPLPQNEVILSAKDQALPLLKDADLFD